MSRSIALPAVLTLAAAFALSGCSAGEREASADTGEPRGELVIFAAASLTDAFTVLGKDFERAHPGVRVKLSFAGSQSLRTQIQNGAQPQVFASANDQHMNRLRGHGLVSTPAPFVSNELVIVVPAANPAGIESLADLPKAKRLVIAGDAVPVGAYTTRMLNSASTADGLGVDFAKRVNKRVVSRETHVRQTLQKVLLGEADAAIVYATDAAHAGPKVRAIEIPSQHNVVATYPIAQVSDAPRSRLGRMFVNFVKSDAGRARLTEFGFRPLGPKLAVK